MHPAISLQARDGSSGRKYGQRMMTQDCTKRNHASEMSSLTEQCTMWYLYRVFCATSVDRVASGSLQVVARWTCHTLVKILCNVAPVTPMRIIFHITKNSTNTSSTFSNLVRESQKELLLSLNRCVLLTLKCVGGGGGSCIQQAVSGQRESQLAKTLRKRVKCMTNQSNLSPLSKILRQRIARPGLLKRYLCCKDMPLFRLQLHRCLGGQVYSKAALFRSGSRPFSANVTPVSRSFHHRVAATKSDGTGASSSGQGFGKPSTSHQKKQKPEVSNTADALLRSLGGKSGDAMIISPSCREQHEQYSSSTLIVLWQAAAKSAMLCCRGFKLCRQRCRFD